MIDIQVMHDASEIIFYNTSELPVKIIHPMLSDYPNRRVICHWHEDIEMIYTVRGEMNYEVNGKAIRLPEHSVLFVNARQLHYGFAADAADCDFICVLFHPSLLRVSPGLSEKTVQPIIGNECIEYLLFDGNGGADFQIISGCMADMAELKQTEAAGYEWDILSRMNTVWGVIYRRCAGMSAETAGTLDGDRQIQREMVSYIFSHYAETITLEEIASSGRVSRSKCCQIFKKFLGESPIDFVNSYRLEKSCQQLRKTSMSVTEIALRCGFNHSSYYTKLFGRKYGCTPSQYRNN